MGRTYKDSTPWYTGVLKNADQLDGFSIMRSWLELDLWLSVVRNYTVRITGTKTTMPTAPTVFHVFAMAVRSTKVDGRQQICTPTVSAILLLWTKRLSYDISKYLCGPRQTNIG